MPSSVGTPCSGIMPSVMSSAPGLIFTLPITACIGVLAEIQLPPEPRWANMFDPTILGTWGLDWRICVGDDYDACQR
jgi:hypothetical protein